MSVSRSLTQIQLDDSSIRPEHRDCTIFSYSVLKKDGTSGEEGYNNSSTQTVSDFLWLCGRKNWRIKILRITTPSNTYVYSKLSVKTPGLMDS